MSANELPQVGRVRMHCEVLSGVEDFEAIVLRLTRLARSSLLVQPLDLVRSVLSVLDREHHVHVIKSGSLYFLKVFILDFLSLLDRRKMVRTSVEAAGCRCLDGASRRVLNLDFLHMPVLRAVRGYLSWRMQGFHKS